jgi:hypothetical protein
VLHPGGARWEPKILVRFPAPHVSYSAIQYGAAELDWRRLRLSGEQARRQTTARFLVDISLGSRGPTLQAPLSLPIGVRLTTGTKLAIVTPAAAEIRDLELELRAGDRNFIPLWRAGAGAQIQKDCTARYEYAFAQLARLG